MQGATRRKIVRFLKHGVLMDVSRLEEWCRANLGDITFREAYQLTKRNINIVLTHAPEGEGVLWKNSLFVGCFVCSFC